MDSFSFFVIFLLIVFFIAILQYILRLGDMPVPNTKDKELYKKKEDSPLIESIKVLDRPFPAVKRGACIICGLANNAHEWRCVTYFIDASTSFMYRRVVMARDILKKLDEDKNLTGDEVKAVLKELTYAINLRDGLADPTSGS